MPVPHSITAGAEVVITIPFVVSLLYATQLALQAASSAGVEASYQEVTLSHTLPVTPPATDVSAVAAALVASHWFAEAVVRINAFQSLAIFDAP